MKFIKVFNNIRNISANEVTFDNPRAGAVYGESNGYTTIRRYDGRHRQIHWKLMPDGIYVHRDIVVAHKLVSDES